jgi:hypothetical protein
VLRVGHFDSLDLVRQLAMTLLMEFSTASTNHAAMAKNEVLVSTIVQVVLVEKNANTRECAISTLQNFDSSNIKIWYCVGMSDASAPSTISQQAQENLKIACCVVDGRQFFLNMS